MISTRIRKCERCFSRSNLFPMKRIYVKHEGKWVKIGWFCPCCKRIVLDEGISLKRCRLHKKVY